jgi:hypothetical protein
MQGKKRFAFPPESRSASAGLHAFDGHNGLMDANCPSFVSMTTKLLDDDNLMTHSSEAELKFLFPTLPL